MNKISVTIEGASWGDVVNQMVEFVGRAEYTPPAPLHVATAPADIRPEESVQQAEARHAEPPHIAETFKPFSPAAESWPTGQCPKHLRPWKDGKYGAFCSAKDESGPKGYCVLKPGDIWNAKNIPLVPTGPAAPVHAA